MSAHRLNGVAQHKQANGTLVFVVGLGVELVVPALAVLQHVTCVGGATRPLSAVAVQVRAVRRWRGRVEARRQTARTWI